MVLSIWHYVGTIVSPLLPSCLHHFLHLDPYVHLPSIFAGKIVLVSINIRKSDTYLNHLWLFWMTIYSPIVYQTRTSFFAYIKEESSKGHTKLQLTSLRKTRKPHINWQLKILSLKEKVDYKTLSGLA